MKLPEQHIFLTASEMIKVICQPIFDACGFNYFQYFSARHNGYCIGLTSDSLITRYALEESHYVKPYELCHGVSYRKYEDTAWSHISKEFQIGSFFRISASANGYIESFGFGSPDNNASALSTYIQDPALIRLFCQYFKNKAQEILAISRKQSVLLSEYRGYKVNMNCMVENNHDVERLFLREVTGLSYKEIDCLKLYMQGYTAKEIAKKVCCGYRTVEHHISSVKCKLNITTRSQLVDYYHSLFAFPK